MKAKLFQVISRRSDCGIIWNGKAWGLLLALYYLTLPIAAHGQYTYTTNSPNTNTITITGYTGGGASVNIPTIINGKTVTIIGANAFYRNTYLMTVTIPGTVVSIGSSAFQDCTNLTSATIPNGVTNIGSRGFYGCLSLKNATIPDSVTIIDNYTFSECGSLTNIIIGSGVKRIGTQAFQDCDGLTSVTIPNNVTNIGPTVFLNCGGLKRVVIGDGVISIEDGAFFGCAGLTNIFIGGSVATIGDSVFEHCGMKSIEMPGSVKVIGSAAFSSCTNLTDVTIPNSVAILGGSAFQGCNNLTNIIIGSGVTNIGNSAFARCDNLKTVTIPDCVISMGYSVFASCAKLTSVAIGSGVTEIGSQVFYYCTSLKSITVPDGVTNLGDHAFWNCLSLTNAVIGNGLTLIEDKTFVDCSGLRRIIIGNGVTRIGDSAFSGCNNLRGAYFSGNAPSVGANVFSGCTNSTVYYLFGTSDWPPVPDTWAGRPTALWGFSLSATFDAQGGLVSPTSATVTNGMTYGVLPTPTREGYLFGGWWTGAGGTGTEVTSETTVVLTASHTLYAKWSVMALAINPASTNLSSLAAVKTIGVTANVPWTAVSNVSWLAVTGGSSGVSNGTVTFSVATNSGTSSRTGGVIIAGGGIFRTCTVSQAAGTAAALAISPASTNLSSLAASGLTIGVTANVSWTAVSNAAWIAVTGGSPGASNGIVMFSVATNPATSSRTGRVVVAGGGISRTCTVIQAGGPAMLAISPAITNFSSVAASGNTIEVTANVSWTAATNQPWIVGTGGRSGTNNGTVTFSVAANPSTSFRTGAVIVTGGGFSRTCTVTQTGAATALTISPASTNFSSVAASGKIIGVSANVAWTAVSNKSWIVVTGGSPGISNGTVTFSVATNPSTSSRTGAVIVAGGGLSSTCTVTQAGAVAVLAISPTSTNFSSVAASGRFIGVTANVAWTAVSNKAWIVVTGGSPGISNGTVTFSVATNPATLSRTGTVIIAGGGISRTCMVIQAGGPAALEISPVSTNYSSDAASDQTIDVTANTSWTAVSNVPWIAVTEGSADISDGMVTFSVATNPATTSRTGAVIIAGGGISRTCTVSQAGAAAALEISPASTNFSSVAASDQTIEVTANVPWTAESSASWLTGTDGSPGVSNGTVTYSVATNPVTTSRTGAVIIAGGGISRTCTVTQAGAAEQRIIGLSGSLAFGNVVTNHTATATMTISNSGNTELTVASIDYPTGFSGAWSGSIAAGNSTNLAVMFLPMTVAIYSGTITVNSDKTSGENTISVSGLGAIWRPTAEDDESFGVHGGQFGFNISWATGRVVVVDACTNLANPIWIPLQTNTLTGGLSYYGDLEWTNHIGRFYRIRSE